MPNESGRHPNNQRDSSGIADKVLIIGLDGATWDVLHPMMESGRMPHLRAFVGGGVSGVLESTKPPITPAAWTTFMTGRTPGSHGILDFERYDVQTNKLSFNSTFSLNHVRTIWQLLGDRGLKVGAVNVPMTYPPPSVNGFVVSGFETPGVETEFTHPKGLRTEILRRWPDYTFKTNWRRKTFGGLRLFRENLNDTCDSFRIGTDVTRFCGERFGWDVLMVVFKLVDNLQHKVWKYLDPRLNRRHPEHARLAADCFAHLDRSIGDLLTYADQHGASVLMMSDHGHGSLEGKSQPNLLLKEWGYLHVKPGAAQSQTRFSETLKRAWRGKKSKFVHQDQLENELAVDFSRTRACVMHAGMYGFLYINLKGRQPTGIVGSDEYETLREELRRRILAVTVTNPAGKSIHLFPEVHRPEELYHCQRADRAWMPDLMLVPAEGLSAVRKIRGSSPVRWLPWRKIEGTHRLEGIFAARGPGIRAAKQSRANIIDVAPTLLAMLGLRVPQDMEGRVMTDLFDPPIRWEWDAEHSPRPASVAEPVHHQFEYSEDEQRLLTERLADLGYLE